MTTTIQVDAAYLHNQDRANRMLAIENHVATAAALTRAVWLMLSEGIFGFDGSVDPRDRAAVEAVASAAADHASAADALLAASPKGTSDVPQVLASGSTALPEASGS